MVRGRDVSSYCNLHGKRSQNVLAACKCPKISTYFLNDSKLLSDALSRRNGHKVPKGKYFLVDCEVCDIISKILQVMGANASWVWSSILEGLNVINQGVQWQVINGESVRLWHDCWIHPIPGARLSGHLSVDLGQETRVATIIDPTTQS
ncbi:unnamed protein product [Prunus brigantina]